MNELTGSESGLVAYYKMSNGIGLTVTDNTGRGKDGQLMDGTNIVPGNGIPPLWVISGAFDNIPPTPIPSPMNTNTFTPSPSPQPPTTTPWPTQLFSPTASLPPVTNTPLPTATATLTRTTRPTFTASPSPIPPTMTQTFTETLTRTPRPTFTPSVTPVGTNTRVYTPTRVLSTQTDLTPTRTIDPNMNNFIFLPLVRK